MFCIVHRFKFTGSKHITTNISTQQLITISNMDQITCFSFQFIHVASTEVTSGCFSYGAGGFLSCVTTLYTTTTINKNNSYTLGETVGRVAGLCHLERRKCWHACGGISARQQVVERRELIGSCLFPPSGPAIAEPHLKSRARTSDGVIRSFSFTSESKRGCESRYYYLTVSVVSHVICWCHGETNTSCFWRLVDR